MNSPLLTSSTWCLILLLLLLSGCALSPSGKQPQTSQTTLLKNARQAEQTGAYEKAAQHYLQLASMAQDIPQGQTYRLRAVSVLLHGNFIQQAQHILEEIDTHQLNPLQQAQKRALAARIALIQNQPHTAIELLAPLNTTLLPTPLAAKIQELRAQAFLRENKLLASIRARIARESLLPATDSEQIHRNQILLWQSLQQLPDSTLQQLHTTPPPGDTLTGWLALARIARQLQTQPQQVQQLLADWRQSYPHHPAAADIIAALRARQSDTFRRPRQIALLLPHNGPYVKPAAALRDGFLAAYYRRTDQHYQPIIRIYDTGDDATTMAVYAQAVRDGADFIVGPLKKAAVTRLAAQDRLPVSTLSLNYSPQTGHTPENLYQFGLAPEDEARQVAERAWLDGNNHAIALVPEGKWGQRLLNAFSEDWESLGGSLLEFQAYPPADNDYSHPIQAVLNIDDSERRHRELETIVQQKLAFEPRRRQDVDFIFLAAFPRQARLIRPQLKFYYAGKLPVYATSHIFSGQAKPNRDRDMDGIIFCDIPWALAAGQPPPPLRRTINHLWPETAGQYSRFYALGVDAYRIIPFLNNMRTYRHERFNGQTGTLSLGENNRIFRELSWARFIHGVPRTY